VPPGDAAGWNRAVHRADVLADGEIEIMSFQPCAVAAGRVPELGEAGIVVVINLAGRGALEFRQRQMAAQVEEQFRLANALGQFLDRHSPRVSVVTDQRR
jgi:hypothetical protein